MEFILNAGQGIGLLMFLTLLFKKGKDQGHYFFLGWLLVVLGQILFYQISIYYVGISGIAGIMLLDCP